MGYYVEMALRPAFLVASFALLSCGGAAVQHPQTAKDEHARLTECSAGLKALTNAAAPRQTGLFPIVCGKAIGVPDIESMSREERLAAAEAQGLYCRPELKAEAADKNPAEIMSLLVAECGPAYYGLREDQSRYMSLDWFFAQRVSAWLAGAMERSNDARLLAEIDESMGNVRALLIPAFAPGHTLPESTRSTDDFGHRIPENSRGVASSLVFRKHVLTLQSGGSPSEEEAHSLRLFAMDRDTPAHEFLKMAKDSEIALLATQSNDQASSVMMSWFDENEDEDTRLRAEANLRGGAIKLRLEFAEHDIPSNDGKYHWAALESLLMKSSPEKDLEGALTISVDEELSVQELVVLLDIAQRAKFLTVTTGLPSLRYPTGPVTVGDLTVEGPLNAVNIRRLLTANTPALEGCFRDFQLPVDLIVDFTIDRSTRVRDVTLVKPTTPNRRTSEDFTRCMKRAFDRIVFPSTQHTEVKVSLPLRFEPSIPKHAGGSVAPPAKLSVLSFEVTGPLAANIVRRYFRRTLPRIQHCYATQLALSPNLEGEALVTFKIAADGTVPPATSTGPLGTVVNECIQSAAQTTLYPRPLKGKEVLVNYKIGFKAL